MKVSINLIRGIRSFLLIQAGLVAISMLIGLAMSPPVTAEPCFAGLPTATAINLVCSWQNIGEVVVRFALWLIYAWLYRGLIVANAMDFRNRSLAQQVKDADGNNSPAWLLLAGYTMLAIVIVKVAYINPWSLVLFGPYRVLFGSLIMLAISTVLVRRVAAIRTLDQLCEQIGLPNTDGVAIIIFGSAVLAGLFT